MNTPRACLILVIGLLACSPVFGEAEPADATALAKGLIGRAGISRGLCSVLGCDHAGLPVSIASSTRFLVHALDPRPADIAAARAAADAQGEYVPRVIVERVSFNRLPYADNVVDLVVAVDPPWEFFAELPVSEVIRVLRPNGKAIVGTARQSAYESSRKAFTQWAQSSGAPAIKAEKDNYGLWVQITKPPLPGVDSWSHWEHGPDNNPVSTDTAIKPPYMTQWMGEPYYITMPAITTAAGGRIFLAMGHIAHHEREEQWLNTLIARNGYNGVELWRRKLPDGYLVHRSAFIAGEDTFYMIDLDGNGCLLLDPETGAEKREIRIPDVSGEWKWMALKDDTLFVLAGGEPDPPETTIVRSERTHWSWGELSKGYYSPRVPWGFGTTIAAYDLIRDETRWCHREEAPIDSRSMAVGGGSVFFYCPDAYVGRLDEKTGDVVWINPDARIRELIEQPGQGLSSTPGFRTTPFCLYTPEGLFYAAQTRMNVVALSPEDGRLLWHRGKTTSNPNMLYVRSGASRMEQGVGGQLLGGIGPNGSTLVIDPATGTTIEDLNFAKRSCARLTATPDSFFCRGMPEGVTRYDRVTGKVLFNGAFRPACNDGVIAANGLLYIGPWTCDCNLTLMGTVSLCSAGGFDAQTSVRAGEGMAGSARSERGEGDIARVVGLEVTDQDWPTYRGNNARNGSARVGVADDLEDVWTYQPRHVYKSTPAAAAGGFVFLCGSDGRVRALDAMTGTPAWSFQTAGPIMQPPTIWNSRAYVGSGDGYIYAIEAATGRLLWRYRVAPIERRMLVYGALCSTWPVNSGVLVHDGVAYAAAGIVDYDGTYICALDAENGDLKWENTTSGHLDKEIRKGVSAQGGLAVAGGRLWMAGGNVVSPVSYDLETGEYLGPSAGDGSPRANRGEEIGVFHDGYLVFGGRLRYSARENVVDPGVFQIARLPFGSEVEVRDPMPLCSGKIPPVWSADHVVAVNGRGTKPVHCRAEDLVNFVNGRDARRIPPSSALTGIPANSDVVALAMARNAVFAAYEMRQPGILAPGWRLCRLDLTRGEVTWQRDLPESALPGGILIDRDGRVVVVLDNGGVVCYGGPGMVRAHVEALAALARRDEAGRQDAVSTLSRLLGRVHGQEGRRMVVASLAELSVDVGRASREAGCITKWHLIGPVPWDAKDHPLDDALIGEPNVDVTRPCKVGSKSLAWREYDTELADGAVDLVRIYGSRENVAIYAYAEVNLSGVQGADSAERELLLKIGSNDGFKCWFNGEVVGRFDGGRAYSPDQDTVKVRARQGVNTILLKVSQWGGAWAFGVRVTDTGGEPLDLASMNP